MLSAWGGGEGSSQRHPENGLTSVNGGKDSSLPIKQQEQGRKCARVLVTEKPNDKPVTWGGMGSTSLKKAKKGGEALASKGAGT